MSDEIQIKLQEINLRLDMQGEKLNRQERMQEIIDRMKDRKQIIDVKENLIRELEWRIQWRFEETIKRLDQANETLSKTERPSFYTDFRRILLFFARRLRLLPTRKN